MPIAQFLRIERYQSMRVCQGLSCNPFLYWQSLRLLRKVTNDHHLLEISTWNHVLCFADIVLKYLPKQGLTNPGKVETASILPVTRSVTSSFIPQAAGR